MCYMDANIISMMLSSVLPLELVQDIYQTKVNRYVVHVVLYYQKDSSLSLKRVVEAK